jgi:hypothetical protein
MDENYLWKQSNTSKIFKGLNDQLNLIFTLDSKSAKATWYDPSKLVLIKG